MEVWSNIYGAIFNTILQAVIWVESFAYKMILHFHFVNVAVNFRKEFDQVHGTVTCTFVFWSCNNISASMCAYSNNIACACAYNFSQQVCHLF